MKKFFYISLLVSTPLWADDVQNSAAAPKEMVAEVPGGPREVEKPLNINGQTRNLSMMMTLKNDKDQIQFLDIRRNYKNEVPKTNY